jgi:hypothetical protein
MIRIVSLGFDLELYDEHEYLSVIWYLCQLSNIQYQHYTASQHAQDVIHDSQNRKSSSATILF